MQLLDGLKSLLYCGLPNPFEEMEQWCCQPPKEEDPLSRFVSGELQADGRSSLEINFGAETPGDILGVSIYDPTLRKEDLKRVANQVFKNTHADRFQPHTPFALTHGIDTSEKAGFFFSVYRRAYEEFCEQKGWGT